MVGLILALVLFVAACGDDDDSSAEPPATAEPSVVETDGALEADGSTADPGGADSADDPENSGSSQGRPFVDDPAIEGLRIYEIDYSAEAIHLSGELPYEDAVPTGGAHSPFWQFCGYYTVEVPEERALHSMEHGAVWIAYREGVDLSAWADRANAETHLLVAQGSGMDHPIVVSAWGAQIDAETPDDPRIDAFIEMFIRQGPEAAPCTGGGVGQPPDQLGPPLDL